MFLFHARREKGEKLPPLQTAGVPVVVYARTRTDRPDAHPSRTAPGQRRSASKTLPHKNERARTRVRAQKQADVCKRKLLGGGRSGRPRVFPFLQLPWRRKRQTQPEMSAVLFNPKHFYISQPERSLSLSLSLLGGKGGWGSQANTFTPTARVEVTLLLPKGERGRQRSTE